MSSSFPATRFPALSLRKEKEATEPISENRGAALPAEEPSDEVLIARICADDSEALGLLFSRYARLAWTIAYRILRNREEADDLLQDIFLLVRRKASVFDASKGTVRSLLVQICYQRAFSRRRDLARRNFYSSGETLENTTFKPFARFYDQSFEARFGKTALQTAFRDLTVEQRETLRLYFAEGYTLEEIAERFGQSYGNIRHYYYRGLAKLRKHLKSSRL